MEAASGTAAVPADALENQLKLSLRPVKPSPEFVDHLHYRLKSPATTILERRQNTGFGLLVVAFSLVCGLALVWMARLVRSLFS